MFDGPHSSLLLSSSPRQNMKANYFFNVLYFLNLWYHGFVLAIKPILRAITAVENPIQLDFNSFLGAYTHKIEGFIPDGARRNLLTSRFWPYRECSLGETTLTHYNYLIHYFFYNPYPHAFHAQPGDVLWQTNTVGFRSCLLVEASPACRRPWIWPTRGYLVHVGRKIPGYRRGHE